MVLKLFIKVQDLCAVLFVFNLRVYSQNTMFINFGGGSVIKSCPTLRPRELQHVRLPCPSLSPWAYSNSRALSQWCHPTISSSVTPFSSCPQSFPPSWSFQMSQFFTWGGQSIGALASAPVLPMNIQGWFPLELTGLISLLSKGPSTVVSSTKVRKHQFLCIQPSLWSNSHICTWLLENLQLWLFGPLSAKWCLCFLIHCLGLS